MHFLVTLVVVGGYKPAGLSSVRRRPSQRVWATQEEEDAAVQAVVEAPPESLADRVRGVLRRATRAEQEAEKSRKALASLEKERESFMQDRDREIEIVEQITGEAQKAKETIKALESEVSDAARRIQRAEARIQTAEAKAGRAEQRARDIAAAKLDLENRVELSEAAALAAEERAAGALEAEEQAALAVERSKRDMEGLQKLLAKQEAKAQRTARNFEEVLDRFRKTAEEATKQAETAGAEAAAFATLVFSTGSVQQARLEAKVASARLAEEAARQDANAARLEAAREAEARRVEAEKAAQAKQGLETRLLDTRSQLIAAVKDTEKLALQVSTLEAELDDTPTLLRRLRKKLVERARRLGTSTKKLGRSAVSGVARRFRRRREGN